MNQRSNSEFVDQKTGGKHGWPVQDIILRKDQVLADNSLIRRPNVKITLTPEQELERYKCALDPIYFSKTYLRIISLDDGIVPFDMYPYQEDLVRMFAKNRFCIGCLSRQLGKTTTVAAFIVWYMIFTDEGKQAAVLANKADQAVEIMDRIRLMYEELPYFLQQGAVKFNYTEILLENKSKVFSGSSNPDTVRGKSLHLVYWDEAAFTARDEEFWTSTFPVLSSGNKTKIILTSTPNGARGVFYKTWKGATETDPEKHNGFAHYNAIWSSIPSRDEAWKTSMIKKTSPSKFQQEHETKFLGSSGCLIPAAILENLFWENPLKDEHNLKIYDNPSKSRKYVAIADCAEGLGQDYSVCTVFDVTSFPYKVVAVYRNNEISPLLFPYTLVSICNRYNECPLLIESNNDVGGQVSYITHYELEYPNVIRTKTDDKGIGLKIGGLGSKPGIKTTKKVKMIGCANLKTLLENGLLTPTDQTLIEELGTFIGVGNSFEADEGCNDDVVMTCVLFSWLVKQPWFDDEFQTKTVSSGLQSNIDNIRDSVLDFYGPLNAEEEPPVMVHFGIVHQGIQTVDPVSFEAWLRS